jgi:DNA-binding IclR family transcriptional regulator
VRVIAPVLAQDAMASSHTVGITAVQGDPSTIAASRSEGESTLEITVKVGGALGVSPGGNSVLLLSPDDIARLAQD